MRNLVRRVAFLAMLAALVSGAGLLLQAEPPQEVATWASLGAAPYAPVGAAAVTLADGRTLFAGGVVNGTPSDAVVVFDPAAGSFASAGQLTSPRVGHTATLLEDGRVLIAGGTVNHLLTADLEIFDLSSGTATLAATMTALRSGHAAARLGDGTVLIAGGTGTDGVLQSAEVFDPTAGTASLTTSPMQMARAGASATTLIDGRVLIAGGSDGTQDLASAEIYNPSTQSFQATDTNLAVSRSGHAAVLLPHNNSVLIAGGSSNGAPEASTDLFLPAQFPDPYTYGMGQFAPTGAMAAPRSGAAGGPHVEGYAFVVGGGQTDAEVYRFATIKTDKDDYAPGEAAIITGSGWQPNEEVTLLFQEDPAVHADYTVTVTADAEGNIYHDQWAPEEHDLDVRFYLLARDSQSRAQMTFTDHAPHGGNHNFNFATSGLGVATSITIGGLRNNPGMSHTLQAYSVTFTSPGPSANVSAPITIVGGSNALDSTLTFSGFPTSVPGVGGTYNLVSTSYSSPISVPTTTGTTTVTATYEFVPSDTTAPVITPNVAGTLGNNGWYVSDVTVSWTVTDPESTITSTTGCDPTTINTDTVGTTLTCSATSAGGTASQSVTIKRDATAPSILGSRTPAPNINGWNNSDVTVSFTCSDGLSGLAMGSPPSDTVVSGEGAAQSVSGTCYDLAGNSASDTVSGINIDKTAPSIAGSRTPPPNVNGWNNTDVTVSFACSDSLSGLAMGSPPADTVLSGEGANQSVTSTCYDLAGNSASDTVSGINIDKTEPVITFVSQTPAANSNNWNNTNVMLEWSCSDAGSVVVSASVFKTVTTEGANQSATGTCEDLAGNTASNTVSGINVDKTAPSILGSRTPAANVNGWNNTDVTVSFACSDGLSGLAMGSPPADTVLSAEGMSQSVPGSCFDLAGNSASDTVSGINIDKTAPSISGSRTPAPNVNGWNNTDVTVSFACSDGLSGLAMGSPPPDTVLSSDGAGQSVIRSCYDLAGNSASDTVSGINIDKTAPVITITSPANGVSYILNAALASDYGCVDATSGVSSCVGPVADGTNFSTSPVGGHSFTVNATDNAGNSALVTHAYSVTYAPADTMCLGSPGHQILQPINGEGTSIFKQKSTVPAKFRVCDANGTSIGTPGVVTSFKLVGIMSGLVTDAYDDNVGSTTPDTAFRWDSTEQQWIFNINTKAYQANKTYFFEITLNDASKINFSFGLK